MPTDQLNLTFAALADPTRRSILTRLAEGEATVQMITSAGGQAIFTNTDVTKSSDVEAMVAKTVAAARDPGAGGRG
jgi:DNA-binding transcriptional ArsR family regulator